MGDMDVRVDVQGLAEFRRELRRVDAELPDRLKAANVELAGHVVAGAQGRAGTVSRMAAKAAESLRPARTVGGAAVYLGNAATPFAMGAEFGSVRFRQFEPWRGSGGGAGYFLYPEIRAQRDRIIERYRQVLDELLPERSTNVQIGN